MDVTVDVSGDIVYNKLPGKEEDFSYAFQKIDEWTDTWRAIGEGKSLLDPITKRVCIIWFIKNSSRK